MDIGCTQKKMKTARNSKPKYMKQRNDRTIK